MSLIRVESRLAKGRVACLVMNPRKTFRAMDTGTHSNDLYVDPQLKPVIARMRANASARSEIQVTPPEMRARFLTDMAIWNRNPVDIPRVEEKVVEGAFGDVRVRLYDPIGKGLALPALIYFHGGGWIVGSCETVDAGVRLLAKSSGVAVLSVDYALAPEHKFPEPLQDCVAVSHWIRENAGAWGIDTARLAIGGDSAGANLALATALVLRDSDENWLQFLLLIYGVYSADYETESHRKFGGSKLGVSKQEMEMYLAMYLRDEADRRNALAMPMLAKLEGLPPHYLVGAGLDPLRDDSRILSKRLTKACVPNELREYPGVVHGFMSMVNGIDVAVDATNAAAKALRDALLRQ